MSNFSNVVVLIGVSICLGMDVNSFPFNRNCFNNVNGNLPAFDGYLILFFPYDNVCKFDICEI